VTSLLKNNQEYKDIANQQLSQKEQQRELIVEAKRMTENNTLENLLWSNHITLFVKTISKNISVIYKVKHMFENNHLKML